MHPSFLTSPLKRKLQPPTNKQPTTNQHPTNITNQHPTWWTALRWIAQHFALFLLPLLIFSLFESLFFPVGDPGCLLSSLPKRLHKMTGELPMCIFGSPTIKNSNISTKKNPRRILGPHFPTRTFLALLLFFCDTNVFFLTMFKGRGVFLSKNIFRDIYVFGIQCFF